MLFFLLGFRLTGPFVVMIYKMLISDVLRFCIIFAIFLLGFSHAFFVLFEAQGVLGLMACLKMCFTILLGELEFADANVGAFPAFSIALLLVYVVLVSIMLLNLLIAMMGETYANINEDADGQWQLERARIIFAIESKMTLAQRNDPENKYWTVVDGQKCLQIERVNRDHFRPNRDKQD